MSLIKSTLIVASLALAGALSANAATAYDSSRVEAMRFHETKSPVAISSEARQAQARAIIPTRRAAPFSRASVESLTW